MSESLHAGISNSVRLEDLVPGIEVSGIVGALPVVVVQVTWHGPNFITLTYKDQVGKTDQVVLGRDKEPSLSVTSAGTGLNIQAASVVILCEPQIKPSLEVQAIARAHRMGQVRKVQVHRLILPDSVDENMLSLLAYKQDQFEQYARKSELANTATGAKEVSEESIAKVIVMSERKRLGITNDSEKIILKEE